MSTPAPNSLGYTAGEPAWDVARLFPEQGTWSVEEYLALTGNRLVEYSHGYLEVLPMPTMSHQLISLFIYRALEIFATAARLGVTIAAPLKVQLWEGKFREPDVLFCLARNRHFLGELFWTGADLVVEVVSNDDRRRDLETKRREYAQANIPEYWIVDPQRAVITVLRLVGNAYEVAGEYGAGTRAVSVLLPGFEVDVAAAFEAGQFGTK